jgi:Lrp/AsnC family transcriptional regulator for asnA, asnC and gidA
MRSKDVPIDEMDFDILKHLQEDGRRSYTDIAKDLGVSVATIRYRITKMLQDETLRVIGRAEPYRIGFGSPADLQVTVLPGFTIDEVAKVIAQYPEVSYLAKVTGDYDLHMDVMCRDRDHLSRFVSEIRKIPGVGNTRTNIILDVYKMAQADLDLVDPRRDHSDEEAARLTPH